MNIQSFFKEVRSILEAKNYDALNNLDLPKPEYFNWVMDVFYELNVQQYPNEKALIWRYRDQEKQFSFKSIYESANQVLNFLRRNKIVKGDAIYTQLSLDPANWITTLAAIKGGFPLIPSAVSLLDTDIAYRFNKIFPKVIIADAANAPKIDAAEHLINKKIALKIIVDGDREGWYGMDVMEKESKDAEADNTKSDDDLYYFFTSGTTGLPKVVTHTHLTLPAGHLTTSAWLGLTQSDIHYNISAPGWAKFAYSSFFGPWNMGATILALQVDQFIAKEQLELIEHYGVTSFCAPPTVLRLMVQEDLKDYQFKFKQCLSAGEPLNPEIIEKWKQATGIVIRDGYGQTETTVLAGNMPGAFIKYGSMGKQSFMYNLIIADDEGNALPNLTEGNICVDMQRHRINGVFTGYYGEPERNKLVFKNQLYYTGDKAYRDEDGYIWFVGRDDDVIKASDFRIGPFEVESILIEHNSVVEAAVVASPHTIRGNAVKAFIILQKDVMVNKALAEELFAFCDTRLAVYKIPRIIEFVESLPKTISGKIRRVELRANEAVTKHKQEQSANEYFHRKY